MGCRSWRGSSEQLQWQVADLQRKLKDSEQRSTLWARRAGAAEARMPVPTAPARLPLPTGLFPAGCDPASQSAAWAGWMGTTEGLIGTQAYGIGRSGSAIGNPAELMGDGGVRLEEGLAQMQGRAATGQQAVGQEDHEQGCALALLQEALSAAPGTAALRMHTGPTTALDNGLTIGARHMQEQEPVLSATVHRQDATSSTCQLSSLQQRIADYEHQNGLNAFQGHSLGNATSFGKLNSLDGTVSPLKQRIAEYDAQHVTYGSPRSHSPTFSSGCGDSRTNH